MTNETFEMLEKEYGLPRCSVYWYDPDKKEVGILPTSIVDCASQDVAYSVIISKTGMGSVSAYWPAAIGYWDRVETRCFNQDYADFASLEAVLLKAMNLRKVCVPSEAEFRNMLTELEDAALTIIKHSIDQKGNVSIVKLVQASNISRPIWTSLLSKMEHHNFAKVQNQGVKGTYIEFKEQ